MRPCQTHLPRSYQIRHRRIVSETYNLAAAGSSPDLLKKQSSYQTISKKSLYRPKNAEVQLSCTVCINAHDLCVGFMLHETSSEHELSPFIPPLSFVDNLMFSVSVYNLPSCTLNITLSTKSLRCFYDNIIMLP